MLNPELLEFFKTFKTKCTQRLYHEYSFRDFNWTYGTHYESLIICFYIFFLTDPESFYLKTCTEPTKANISICLRLEKKENFTCDEEKITHVLSCGKNIALIGIFLW